MRTTKELEAGLDEVRASPRDGGRVELIVRRPAIDEREVVETAELSLGDGLVGDMWRRRPSPTSPDGGPHPDKQVTLINARFSALIADDDEHRVLAGDQIHADLDLSVDNLPPGTQLAIGDAVIEVTASPHPGCAKFSKRFGADVRRFVNGVAGSALRLRGVNARVVRAGTIAAGDKISKL